MVLLILASPFWASAQLDSSIGTTIIDIHKVSVAPNPRKVFTEPEIKEPESKLPKFEYDVPKFVYRVGPLYTPAQAIGIKPGADQELYGNYFKLGFGNYMTPFAEVYLNNLRNDDYDYGGYARHFSSNNGKPQNADFSENRMGIYGKKFGTKGTLSGKLDYSRDVIHYYGYNHDADTLEVKKRDINQIYNLFSGQTEFSYKPKRKLEELTLGFDFYTLSNIGSRENNFDIYNRSKVKMGKGLGGLDLNVQFVNLNADTQTYNRFYVTGHPFYKFDVKKLTLELGLNVIVAGDSSKVKPYIFPNVKMSTDIVKDKLVFYAALDGNVTANRLNDLRIANPFVAGRPMVQNTVSPFNIKAGLKGNVLKKFDFLLQVKNTTYNNYAFFVSDSGYTHAFNVLYDNLNVLSLRTDLSFNHNEKLFIGMGNEFFAYSSYSEDQPWQLPAFRLNFNASYTFAKKLNIRFQGYVLGQRYQRDPESATLAAVRLAPVVDLNVLAQYQYKKNISFFLNFHNVTNSRYQQWYNYPVYGLNVLGGVSFSL